jgi:hypothetical protein
LFFVQQFCPLSCSVWNYKALVDRKVQNNNRLVESWEAVELAIKILRKIVLRNLSNYWMKSFCLRALREWFESYVKLSQLHFHYDLQTFFHFVAFSESETIIASPSNISILLETILQINSKNSVNWQILFLLVFSFTLLGEKWKS